MNQINQSNFIRAKFTRRTLKIIQSFNASDTSFPKTDQNGGAHGKNKEVFKVEKSNPQQEETIKILLEQKDVFLALRTGGGKSLCNMARSLLYSSDIQLAEGGIPQVLIISPLVSITKE